MLFKFHNRHRHESGFTLIELLVVILIIGILSAIAVPMFLNQRKAAVDTATRSDVRNAALEVETGLVKYPQAQCINRPNYPVNGAMTIRFYSAMTGTACSGTLLGSVETRTSEGTNIMPSGNPYSIDGYKLVGWNPGGTQDSSTNGITFLSGYGGFQ